MSKASNYSSIELLRDGRQMEIRAVTPDDRTELLDAVARSSSETLYRRFFGVRRNFTEQEIDFFSNVDFVDHVALVVILKEGARFLVAAGARYIVFEPGKAEMAFAVVDQYQGMGIGTTLMRHLVTIARQAGLSTLTAEVLASNSQMLKVFQKSGLRLRTRREFRGCTRRTRAQLSGARAYRNRRVHDIDYLSPSRSEGPVASATGQCHLIRTG